MEFSRCILHVLVLLIMSTDWIAQSYGLSAKEYFDEAEVKLQLIVKKVEENVGNECALLSTCAAVANCSRYNCFFDVTDIPNYACMSVNANEYCGSRGECPWRNFNFRKSSVSASETTDISSNETTRVICAHRVLDEVFTKVSNETSGNQVYFGSVDGIMRFYPGSDEFPCKNFDPRVRPWYLASLHVKKVVMVVIDVGFSMKDPMIAAGDKTENPLATAQNLTRALFNTLSRYDFINIVVYNSSDATLLAPNPVAVIDSNSDPYPPEHPEFVDLTTKLMNTAVGSANAGPSNISRAMDAVFLNMSTFTTEFMKIAIVLTNGAIGDSTSPVWGELTAAGVKTFVYKFKDSNGIDTSDSEAHQVCSIGGSYEPFPINRRQNPLFALQSYYSFIANARTKMNDSMVYGYEYRDLFQTDRNLFTISQSVYDRNGVLVGVVGLDIHKSDLRTRLGITNSDFEGETNRRRAAYTFNATRDVVLDSTTCTNHTSEATNCGSGISIPPNGSLCRANDQGRSIAEFSCCNGCPATDVKKSNKLLNLGLGIGIPSFILAVVIVVGFIGRKKINMTRAASARHNELLDNPPLSPSN